MTTAVGQLSARSTVLLAGPDQVVPEPNEEAADGVQKAPPGGTSSGVFLFVTGFPMQTPSFKLGPSVPRSECTDKGARSRWWLFVADHAFRLCEAVFLTDQQAVVVLNRRKLCGSTRSGRACKQSIGLDSEGLLDKDGLKPQTGFSFRPLTRRCWRLWLCQAAFIPRGIFPSLHRHQRGANEIRGPDQSGSPASAAVLVFRQALHRQAAVTRDVLGGLAASATLPLTPTVRLRDQSSVQVHLR